MNPVHLETDAEGIAWVVFDDPDAKVNLLNSNSVTNLSRILDELHQRKPKGVVFISGKIGNFIAGADIHEIEKIRDSKHAAELSRAGHQIFEKIAGLGVPTVAAIHGACLGGGCELTLACQYRIATDDPKTLIGLPETQLGIIPGWGGTQRLPRRVGLRHALDLIASGKMISATKAEKIGLIDLAVPSVTIRDTAKNIALGTKRIRRNGSSWDTIWPMRPIICRAARKRVNSRTHGRYPAPIEAIHVVERGLGVNLEKGLEIEAEGFARVANTPVCTNLIRLFFLREKYSKLQIDTSAPIKKIEKVGVIGAGLMGAGIAQWCSARGINVRLKDIQPEYIANGMKRIWDVYRDGVKRRKLSEREAQQGYARVHPTTNYSGFGDCDLIIEAVLEKMEIKKRVYDELTPLLRKDCIIASNTSAIPIDTLAEACGLPKQFVGIHFFNPVHRMPLVEIVRGKHTSNAVIGQSLEFAKQLKKIPVVVKGTPGFLVNRVLMPYLNEAGTMLSEGISVDSIDRAMLDFGMPMGPLRLIDEVGIEVALDVASELAAAYSERMSVAPILSKMHSAKLKGRKGNAGFYVYKGKKEKVNPWLKSVLDRNRVQLPDETIQERLIKVMVAEARLCFQENVVETEDDIDVGMIFGTGFPPFRGGLTKYARDIGIWDPSRQLLNFVN